MQNDAVVCLPLAPKQEQAINDRENHFILFSCGGSSVRSNRNNDKMQQHRIASSWTGNEEENKDKTAVVVS